MQPAPSTAAGPDTTLLRRARAVQRSVPRALATVTFSVAMIVLLGWFTDNEALKTIWSLSSPMLPITAVGIAAASIALALVTAIHWSARWLAALLALSLIALGVQSLAEYLWDFDSPLRLLLFADSPNGPRDWTYTMAQPAALEFILFAATLLLGLQERARRGFITVATFGLLVSSVPILGYLFGARGLIGVGSIQSIAIHTAGAFCVLFSGLLAWRADAGWPKLLIGHTPTARAARALFVLVIALPTACAWIAVQGWRMGLYDSQSRLAVLTLTTIVFLAALVLFHTARLRRAEAAQFAASAALSESEARFRHMADHAPGIVWVTDATHRCTYISKGWCALTGQSEEQALGLGWLEAVHPDDKRDAMQRFNDAVAMHRSFESEYRLQRGDGGFAWIINRAIPRFSPEGRFLGYIGSLLDITERRALEVRLRQQAALLDQTHDAVVMWSTNGGVRYWNRGATDLYGFTSEQALGKNIHELLGTRHPEPLPRVLERLHTEGSWSGELRHVAMDDRTLIVESRQTVIDVEGESLVMEVNRDVTTRKAFERALQQSEERLRLATEAANIGVWTWDLDADAMHWNAQCRLITGVERTPRNREEWQRLLHPDDREQVHRAETRAIEQRSVYRVEFRLVRPDGVVRWLASVGRADYGDDNAPVRLLGLMMDITEQRNIEQALRDADRRKNEFLAMLGHELRNPLAPIRNAAMILRKQAAADSSIRTATDIIDRQIRHMVRLVDDLLDVSRITLGRIAIRKERVNLSAVLATAVEAARPIVEKSRHELTIALSGEPIELDADATRLSQVVLNLLNNAVKYTPPGGRITLTTAKVGADAVISVRDNGIGIAPEMLSFVFGMFTQVESANDRAQGGLGIGLALARALVDLHGGRIEARSEGVGKGSEFTITLPLPVSVQAPAPAPQQSKDDLTIPADPSRRRVLIVDDNVDGAESLAMHLRLAGLEARAVYEGRPVAQLVKTFQPEVLVCDIGLPDMTGYSVAELLRERYSREQLTLIALTGWGQEEDKRRAREAGFDHHFTKPVDPELISQLISRLQTHPAKQSSARSAAD